MSKTIYYSTSDDHDSRFKLSLASPVDITRPIEQEDIAEEAADDYHDRHDGWESGWPLEIALYASEDGVELARFKVVRDYRTEFTAYPITLE